MADGVASLAWLRALEAMCPEDHTYKLALFPDELGLDAEYDPTLEMVGQGYAPGGKVLTGRKVELVGGVAVLKFDRFVTWDDAYIAARSALIYDETTGTPLRVIDFGRTVGVIGGVFDVKLNEEGVIHLGVRDEDAAD